MNTTLKLKIGLLFTIIIFSIMTLVPSFYPRRRTGGKNTLPRKD